jgi:hypothetical protein
MIWISAAQAATASPSAATAPPWLLDEFIETYVGWREAAAAANDAYEHWTRVDRENSPLAFAAYGAALDGEEAAARAHRDCVERFAGQVRSGATSGRAR